MKRLMKCFGAIVLLMSMVPSVSFALTCANKPSNATTLATIHFDTTDGEGQLWEIYPGAALIAQPTGVIGNASESLLRTTDTTGGQQNIYPKPGNQQPLSNMYFCIRYKMGPNFVGIRTANKLWFLANQDFQYSSSRVNGFFGLTQVDSSNYPISTAASGFFLYFGHNTSGIDNSHTCALDSGLQCNPNVTTTVLRPDIWYEIEAYIVGSTSTTSRDGQVYWWVDGVQQGRYTNINYGSIINEWQINHTWDNSLALQCSGNSLARDCSHDQIHYFDELLLASVGGLPTGGSGGSTTPPPPPPPVTLTITPSSQPNGRVGNAYSSSMATSGGVSPYAYSVSSGALPAGISMSSGGSFSGTPTTAGSYSFSVTVTDSSSTPVTATQSYTLVVDAAATPNQLTAILGWTDSATNETGYEVSYSTNGGQFVVEPTIAANSTSYTINIPLSGLFQVCARVRAFRDNVNAARIYGNYSTVVCKPIDYIIPEQPASFGIQ